MSRDVFFAPERYFSEPFSSLVSFFAIFFFSFGRYYASRLSSLHPSFRFSHLFLLFDYYFQIFSSSSSSFIS